MIRKMISFILIIGIISGQTLSLNTGKSKETGGNEKKVSWVNKILSFKKKPIILKKNNDVILINPNEKIKVITDDGNIVIGKYVLISLVENQIVLKGLENSKIFPVGRDIIDYDKIKQISRGSGNKSFEYGFGYAAFIGISSLLWLQVAEGFSVLAPLLIGTFMTPLGALGGAIDGYSIPRDFEEPVTIGKNEWSMHFKKDAITSADINFLKKKLITDNSKGNDLWWSFNG